MLLEIIAFIVVGFFVLALLSTAHGQLLAILAFIAMARVVDPLAATIAGIALAGGIIYKGVTHGDTNLFISAVATLIAAIGLSIEAVGGEGVNTLRKIFLGTRINPTGEIHSRRA